MCMKICRPQDIKRAIREILEAQRHPEYGHLSNKRFAKLTNLVQEHSEVTYAEGAKPTIVGRYLFDIDLTPGPQLVRAQLPRYSPHQQELERFHVTKAEVACHLRKPNPEQVPPWTTRTHVVWKKDDANGRWICDFRPLNVAIAKAATAVGDARDKVRPSAGKSWKTMMDAWSGVNQVEAAERAKRLLQIIAGVGLRQWCVLPFGVANGPSSCQQICIRRCQIYRLAWDSLQTAPPWAQAMARIRKYFNRCFGRKVPTMTQRLTNTLMH